jgi:hypothetical protein
MPEHAATATTPSPPPAATPVPHGPGRRFWFNLGLLAVLAPFATYWFQQHLELYFTEIVLIGGGITVWVFLRAAAGLLQSLGKLDALAWSQRLLASAEATLLLCAAAVGLLLLWFTTTSLYFQYEGGGAGDKEFVVQVSRKQDGSPYMADTTVGPAARVAGQALLLRGSAVPLTCTIVRPLNFEPLDCPVQTGRSRRVRVPADFTPRAYHLLRIVPAAGLYRELPRDTDTPDARYNLQVAVGGRTLRFDDLRKQTIHAGGRGSDMALVLGLEDPLTYERFLGASLRAAGINEQSAATMAAVLALRTRTWDALDARQGQTLRFSLQHTWNEGGQVLVRDVEGFPMDYTVTADKVQTIWLPPQ